MAPRRNPDIVVAVLCEHGGWGAEASAPLAAQVVNAFVTKQRKREDNLRAEAPKPEAAPAPPPAPSPASNPASPPIAAVLPSTKPGASKATPASQP
jgi:penicillin-binding protein 2